MAMRVALDLETVCNVADCKGYGQYKLCNHALEPWKARVTAVGVRSGDGSFGRVFRDLSKLKTWVTDNPDVTYENHRFKFDWLMLAAHDVLIPLDRYQDDSHLMADVCPEKISPFWLEKFNASSGAATRHVGAHSLKSLAPYHLGVAPWEAEDKDDDEYILKDCEYASALVPVFEEKLEKFGGYKFYKDRLLPYTKILMEAEYRGVLIDWATLDGMEQELVKERDEAKADLFKVWDGAHTQYMTDLRAAVRGSYAEKARARGKDISDWPYYQKLQAAALKKVEVLSLESPKQLSTFLRDYRGLDIRNFEGKDSTEKAVLKKLARDGHEDVALLLKWRKAKDLIKFLVAYKELHVNSAIHPSYHPARFIEGFTKGGTRTGRLSSSKPNLQQVNKRLRPVFKARPGYKIVGFDLASIEAKLIALYTECPNFYDITATDKSFHDMNVKAFFGFDDPHTEIKKKYPHHRAAVKRIGFSLCYGAGANRIQKSFSEDGFFFTQAECKEFHRRFKEKYKKVSEFHEGVTKIFEGGGIMFNLLGRPIKIQDPRTAYMKGFNRLIQSSASDLCLEGARRALETLRAEGAELYPILFVHDFIGFEVREDWAKRAAEVIPEAMTSFELSNCHGPIELGVEGGVMDNWED